MAESILPGWARTGSMFPPRTSGGLPPWYGVGGARGPSGGGAPPPPSMTPLPAPPRNIRTGAVGGGMAMAPRTGNVAQTPVNTAPTNPWTMQANNTPIYNEDVSGQLGLIDRLLGEMQNSRNTSGTNLQSRMNALGPLNPSTYQATTQNYQRSPEMAEAFKNFERFNESGGFTPQELASIRARGVSPVRAVYANAQRNLNRQRSLQGGYAPGMAAASARMAREMSEQLANASTNVEGELAGRIQEGKRFGAERFGGIAEGENSLINQILQQNARAQDEAGRFNAGATNEAQLQRQRLQQQIFDANAQENARFGNEGVELARLREQILENSRSGRLQERMGSRAGSLNWEELNQRGGQALMDAMMSQYGGR